MDRPKPKKETVEELRRRRNAERRRRRTQAARRQMLFYVFCVAALGGLYWYAQGDLTPSSPYASQARVVLEEAQKTMLRESAESEVQPLSDSDRRSLERQRDIVRTLARRHVGAPPRGGSLEDLRILQTLVDDRVLERDQVYELQALGVVLGDILAEQLDLSWVVVDDQYGRTRALQYGSREDVFFPVTMISKRYEKRIPVDIDELYEKVETEVARLKRVRSRS
jgi:hypothetical protein